MRCQKLIEFEKASPPKKGTSAPVELASCETLTAAPPACSSISKIFNSMAIRKAAVRAGYIALESVLEPQCFKEGFTSAQPILCMASLGVSSAAVN